jgi:arsenite methyltransferase
MDIVDTGSDLNAYAKAEPECGCCCSGQSLPVVEPAATGCCSPTPSTVQNATFHKDMTDLASRYDFNEYAASVKIYAVKR